MRKIGYLRVSTEEQSLERQVAGLSDLCDELHIEKASAARLDRPVYQFVLGELQAGDMLVVWDLDRAYRSTADALTELERLKVRGIEFRVVNLQLDTTTPAGMFVFTMMAAFGEFERRTLCQRTREGMAAARLKGKRIGRPRKLSPAHLELVRGRLQLDGRTVTAVAREWAVTRWTLSRSLSWRAPAAP